MTTTRIVHANLIIMWGLAPTMRRARKRFLGANGAVAAAAKIGALAMLTTTRLVLGECWEGVRNPYFDCQWGNHNCGLTVRCWCG